MAFNKPSDDGFNVGNGMYIWDDFSGPGNIGPDGYGNLAKRFVADYKLLKGVPDVPAPLWSISNTLNDTGFVNLFNRMYSYWNRNQPPVYDKRFDGAYYRGFYLNFSEAANYPALWPSLSAFNNENFYFPPVSPQASTASSGKWSPYGYAISNMTSESEFYRALGYTTGDICYNFVPPAGVKSVFEISFDTGAYDGGGLKLEIGPFRFHLTRRPDDFSSGLTSAGYGKAGFNFVVNGVNEYASELTSSFESNPKRYPKFTEGELSNIGGEFVLRAFFLNLFYSDRRTETTYIINAVNFVLYNQFGGIAASSGWFYLPGSLSNFSVTRDGSFQISEMRFYGQNSRIDLGGYINSRNLHNISRSGFYVEKNLYENLIIPSENLEDQISQVKKIARNISSPYISLRAIPGKYSGTQIEAASFGFEEPQSIFTQSFFSEMVVSTNVYGMNSNGTQLFIPDMFIDSDIENFGDEMKFFWPLLLYPGFKPELIDEGIQEFVPDEPYPGNSLRFKEDLQLFISGFKNLHSPIPLPEGNVGIVWTTIALATSLSGREASYRNDISYISIYQSPMTELQGTVFGVAKYGIKIKHTQSGLLKTISIRHAKKTQIGESDYKLFPFNPEFRDHGTESEFYVKYGEDVGAGPRLSFAASEPAVSSYIHDFNVVDTQYPAVCGVCFAFGPAGQGWKIGSL